MATVVAAARSLFALSGSDAGFYASAENEVSYTVYYVGSGFFGRGARPAGLSYLISYTDYIDVTNKIHADFNQPVTASYRYSATVTLVIRHYKSSDQNTNPVVFKEEYLLFDVSGDVTGDQISLDSADAVDNPGDAQRIDPETSMDIYRNFVTDQRTQEQKEGLRSSAKFTADLMVDFNCHIAVDEKGIDETLTRGVNIPISDEVFIPAETGAPSFEWSVPAQMSPIREPLIGVLLVLWLAAHVFGICYSIRRLTLGKDQIRRDALRIFRKYAGEIVISAIPTDLSGYKTIPVVRFQELVKLAVNTGTCILCYQNDETVEFCAISDQIAYTYSLSVAMEPRYAAEASSGLPAEIAALFKEIDAFIAEATRRYKSLQSFLEVVNSFDVSPQEQSLLERLNSYKIMVFAVRNHLVSMPISKQAGVDEFLEKLECYEISVQSCVDRFKVMESRRPRQNGGGKPYDQQVWT